MLGLQVGGDSLTQDIHGFKVPGETDLVTAHKPKIPLLHTLSHSSLQDG